jgi:hypothetical protein
LLSSETNYIKQNALQCSYNETRIEKHLRRSFSVPLIVLPAERLSTFRGKIISPTVVVHYLILHCVLFCENLRRNISVTMTKYVQNYSGKIKSRDGKVGEKGRQKCGSGRETVYLSVTCQSSLQFWLVIRIMLLRVWSVFCRVFCLEASAYRCCSGTHWHVFVHSPYPLPTTIKKKALHYYKLLKPLLLYFGFVRAHLADYNYISPTYASLSLCTF